MFGALDFRNLHSLLSSKQRTSSSEVVLFDSTLWVPIRQGFDSSLKAFSHRCCRRALSWSVTLFWSRFAHKGRGVVKVHGSVVGDGFRICIRLGGVEQNESTRDGREGLERGPLRLPLFLFRDATGGATPVVHLCGRSLLLFNIALCIVCRYWKGVSITLYTLSDLPSDPHANTCSRTSVPC